ncbi:MAG: ABC transporter permease [Acidobacteria bacterium]|nr:MAG: ABC transporter permease [Acidobacteriota bacterium]REK04594.1 MAG: ABC transporter permease [Acidobacteriota bacterium]
MQRKLLRDLWAQRSQVLAIAAVVATGICLLFAARSTFGSLQHTQDEYYEQGRFADVFASIKRAPWWVAERAAELDGVAQAQARVVVAVNLDVADMEEPSRGLLISLPDRGEPVLNRVLLDSGRWVDPLRDDEAILSLKFAEAHGLEVGDHVVAVINGRRKRLEAVGIGQSPEYVYAISGGDLFPDPRRFGVLWMARRPLASAFDMEGGFNDLSLRLLPDVQPQGVIAELDRLLEPYGGLGAIPRSQQTSHWYLTNELTQLESTGYVVPLLFLTVAAFLLNVVLVRLVAAQREQIAALKALGYSNRAIGLHYVQWGLGVSALGAALGLLGGIWMSRSWLATYETYFSFPRLIHQMSWNDFAQAAGVSVVASMVGALGAVRAAVRLAPAEAMRPAPPATYRQTALERLAEWLQASVAWRIILRNLARRPVRSLLSVVGIAFAGATLVLGSSLVSSITELAAVLFDRMQRQDVMVTFNEPASSSSAFELTSLPGVRSMEPIRTVPARLRSGARSRQVGVLGMVADPRLWRVLDSERGAVAMPAEGLMLSSMLAEILGVRAGDRVEMEVLEGRRPVLGVDVASVVDDYVGASAYMEIEALRRLLGEQGTTSGAVLTIDPLAESELYAALKRTPRVAGVALRSATIENFETFLSDNIGSMMFANLLFAFVIAFGVIYNTARISLAERARELASLRVLGFRRSEISGILLGELGLLTAAGIPLGFGLGVLFVLWAVRAFETELYRIPYVFDTRTFVISAVAVVGSMVVSALVVRRRLHELDLVAVLKSRE